MRIISKKSTILLSFLFTFLLSGICSAQIETSVEPFTGVKTYTSKYTFSDDDRNMHSISLVKSIKPLPGNQVAEETYFLLTFNLSSSVTLGDSFDVQVTDRYINSLSLTPFVVKGAGYSSSPSARTGMKDLPEMTKTAIEKGKELLVRITFKPKGSILCVIPAETIQEWSLLLKESGKNESITKEVKTQKD